MTCLWAQRLVCVVCVCQPASYPPELLAPAGCAMFRDTEGVLDRTVLFCLVVFFSSSSALSSTVPSNTVLPITVLSSTVLSITVLSSSFLSSSVLCLYFDERREVQENTSIRSREFPGPAQGKSQDRMLVFSCTPRLESRYRHYPISKCDEDLDIAIAISKDIAISKAMAKK